MPRARCNGIELEYDTIGDRAGSPLLLIMGLGAQMINWHERLCAQFAARGHWVIRFDNRDIGLSEKLDHLGTPDVLAAWQAGMAGEPIDAPYTFADMADDAAGLLDHLGVDRAHVVGASMGGMIAQTFALRHPDRLLSLTSIYSTTGARSLPQSDPDALAALMAPAPPDRAGAVEQAMRGHHVMGGTLPIAEWWSREIAERSYDRCHYPDGIARQTMATLAQEDRTEALGSVQVPTLVVHGDSDPLVKPEHGEATARAIPGARLEIIEGWGHGLIPAAWPQLVAALCTHTRAVDANGH